MKANTKQTKSRKHGKRQSVSSKFTENEAEPVKLSTNEAETATYDPTMTDTRAAQLKRAVSYGTGVITTAFGVGLFGSELSRIESLPQNLQNDLYLSLLAAVTLLTAGWIVVANKELGIMCEFLHPADYHFPDENLTAFAIALSLVVLLYTCRNPLWFGVSYSIYTALNLVGSLDLREQMKKAIPKSSVRLERARSTLGEAAYSTYRDALNLLNGYYIKQPNVWRVAATLVLACAGLICSLFGAKFANISVNISAYIIYLSSVVCIEGGVAFFWRAQLYRRIRPLAVAKYET